MESEVAARPESGGAIMPARPRRAMAFPARAVAFGVFGSLGLLIFYVGTIALLQDWEHALTQLAEDVPFVAALVAGFGVQVGLLTYTRALAAPAGKAGVAVGAGTSGVAMLACCAHHLTDVLPIVGLSAAATFLGAYKEPLLWLSVAVNAGGVLYLVRQLKRATRALYGQQAAECHAP